VRDIVVTLIIFGAIPFVLIRPYIGTYLWAWISYMNPHRLAYGFAVTMPFAMVTGITMIIGFLFTKDKQKLHMTPVTVVWLALVTWFFVTTIFSIDFAVSYPGLIRTAKIQLVTLLTMLLINSRKKLDGLIWIICLSLGFFGIKGGLFVLLTGGSYRVWGPPDSFVAGNNEIALALLMIVPFFWYLREQVQRRWIKHLILVCILLCILSIISSYSRGAFLAAASLLIVFWLKSDKKVIIGGFLIILIAGIGTFMPEKYFHRMDTIESYQSDDSAMGRINAWHFAYNLALDHPFTGGGFYTFTRKLFLLYAPDPNNFHDAHSIYFQMLGEQGFVGLILFLILWWLTYRLCNSIKKKTSNIEELKWAGNLAAMSQVSIVAYCVGGAFLGLGYFDLPYGIMAICVLTNIFVDEKIMKKNETGIGVTADG